METPPTTQAGGRDKSRVPREPLPPRFAGIVTALRGKEARMKALALKILTILLLAYFAVVFLQQATHIIDSYDAAYFAVVAQELRVPSPLWRLGQRLILDMPR